MYVSNRLELHGTARPPHHSRAQSMHLEEDQLCSRKPIRKHDWLRSSVAAGLNPCRCDGRSRKPSLHEISCFDTQVGRLEATRFWPSTLSLTQAIFYCCSEDSMCCPLDRDGLARTAYIVQDAMPQVILEPPMRDLIAEYR